MAKQVRLRGWLLGERRRGRRRVGLIVRVARDHSGGEPAENAFVYVSLVDGNKARYIAWINLYDIDFAARKQQGQWRTIEPHPTYEGIVEWFPFGWGGEVIPSVADTATK